MLPNQAALDAGALDAQTVEEVKDLLGRALAQQPDSDTANYFLGVLYLDQGKPEEARQRLEMALALNPQHGPAREALSKCG